ARRLRRDRQRQERSVALSEEESPLRQQRLDRRRRIVERQERGRVGPAAYGLARGRRLDEEGAVLRVDARRGRARGQPRAGRRTVRPRGERDRTERDERARLVRPGERREENRETEDEEREKEPQDRGDVASHRK